MEKQQVILNELLNLAHRLEIKVRFERLGDEDMRVQSGLAWVDHQPVLFLDPRLSVTETLGVLIKELSGFPLEDLYIKPGIRALLVPGSDDDATPG